MGECVCFCDRRLAAALPKDLICCRGDEGETGEDWALCALSPEEAEGLTNRPLRCRTLLVPEGIFSPAWQAEQVVGYGLSGRCSLTLSSMDGQGLLCVQRELRDRGGGVVEEQELALPEEWQGYSQLERLLLAGVWLLRGGLP